MAWRHSRLTRRIQLNYPRVLSGPDVPDSCSARAEDKATAGVSNRVAQPGGQYLLLARKIDSRKKFPPSGPSENAEAYTATAAL
jgi:hypothetical protein